MKKQIIITIEDNEVTLSQNGGVTYNVATEVLATAQLLLFNRLIEHAAKELDAAKLQSLKEHAWDTYNMAASNCLDEMIPAHMRKDLSEEAILKEENRILSNLKH